jgi:hypothetical protein
MSVRVNFGPSSELTLIAAGCADAAVQSAYQEISDSRREVRTAFDGAMHWAWLVSGWNVPHVYSNAHRAPAGGSLRPETTPARSCLARHGLAG